MIERGTEKKVVTKQPKVSRRFFIRGLAATAGVLLLTPEEILAQQMKNPCGDTYKIVGNSSGVLVLEDQNSKQVVFRNPVKPGDIVNPVGACNNVRPNGTQEHLLEAFVGANKETKIGGFGTAAGARRDISLDTKPSGQPGQSPGTDSRPSTQDLVSRSEFNRVDQARKQAEEQLEEAIRERNSARAQLEAERIARNPLIPALIGFVVGSIAFGAVGIPIFRNRTRRIRTELTNRTTERDTARTDLTTRTTERDNARRDLTTRTTERDDARRDLATRITERDIAIRERDERPNITQAQWDTARQQLDPALHGTLANELVEARRQLDPAQPGSVTYQLVQTRAERDAAIAERNAILNDLADEIRDAIIAAPRFGRDNNRVIDAINRAQHRVRVAHHI